MICITAKVSRCAYCRESCIDSVTFVLERPVHKFGNDKPGKYRVICRNCIEEAIRVLDHQVVTPTI